MQTKQYFILRPLVTKCGKDNVINNVNKIVKDIKIKKQKNKLFRVIY